MPTAVRSHAKINLGLYIGAPRPDGFHGLTTVYQTLELYDVVTVTARRAAETRLRLTSNDTRVPTDSRNTAWKMVALALESLGVTAEVEIRIEKRLPVQGGLGAGSANAVAALVGLEVELGLVKQQVSEPASQRVSEWRVEGSGLPCLNSEILRQAQDRLWGTLVCSDPLHDEEAGPSTSLRSAQDDRSNWKGKRIEIAAQVGSDVPLFLVGGAVLGVDRGQEVYPLPDFEPTWCVIAAPAIGVSTPQAFRDWDALCAAEGLTQEASADKLNELSRAYVSAFAGVIQQGGQGTGSSGVLSLREDRAGPEESALVRTGISSWIQNDFERVVFPQHPSLAEIKRILMGSGTPEAAIHASLSGSGSALYGLYRTRGDAEAAQVRLKSQFREADVRSTLTRTLPRPAYWNEMLLEE
jgi:4-diphosphocytidyl-2-C-methyl-D-erythritol kinase